MLSTKAVGSEIPMQFDLTQMVERGHRIFLNDGLVELEVGKVEEDKIICVAKNDGWVTSNKGVNIPDTHFSKDIFTSKDREDVNFAIKEKAEYVALSFIQNPDEVIKIKKYIRDKGGMAKVCVKVEKKEAVDNIEEIVRVADAVMIARGDLAIETSESSVPVLQQ
ncbi:MAG: pyruvate kinase, partial [Candidatus Levybacteria bacterium CG10_big_fil_rev_8_21_14_0_10_36_7]